MREIKFRAWVGKMEYDVVTGRFGTFYVNSGDKGDGLDVNDSATLTPFNTKYPDGTPIMQYTGLNDRHGREIYEGDIVITSGEFSLPLDVIVYWNEQMASFCLSDKDGIPVGAWHYAYPLDVIGNIWENPELLDAR